MVVPSSSGGFCNTDSSWGLWGRSFWWVWGDLGVSLIQRNDLQGWAACNAASVGSIRGAEDVPYHPTAREQRFLGVAKHAKSFL